MSQVARFAPAVPAQAGARAETQSVGRAWVRELQRRAQAFSWFPAAIGAPQAVAAPTAATAPSGTAAPGSTPGVASSRIAPSVNLDPRRPIENAASSRIGQQALSQRTAREAMPASSDGAVHEPDEPSFGPSAAAVPSSTRIGPARQLASAPLARPPAPAHAKPEQPPVRLHVEHGSGGLRVWLGVDAHHGAAAACAATLMAGLLADGPFRANRLAAVVCNGATVYASPTPAPSLPATSHSFQEQPWHSAQ